MSVKLYDEKLDTLLYKEHPFHECDIVSEDSLFLHPATIDVSVIIPCYNVARFLQSCINSLATQKSQYSFEIIWVNDGSTDGSKEMLDKAAEQHVTFQCIHQSNQGAGAARTQGMRNARGKYLIFIDADDIVSPDYIEALTDCIKTKDADMGVCSYYSFNEKGVRYKTVKWQSEISTRNLNGTPWGKIFRRELFERLIWPSGYWHQDTILAFLVYPNVRKIAVTNKCSYGYRSSTQNTTNSSRRSKKALDTLYITSIVLSEMEKLNVERWLNTVDGHDRLVNQFYLNQCRIQHLPESCRKEVFRLQSNYYQKMTYENPQRHMYDSYLYERALYKGNRKLARISVKMEKANKAMHVLISQIDRLIHRY